MPNVKRMSKGVSIKTFFIDKPRYLNLGLWISFELWVLTFDIFG